MSVKSTLASFFDNAGLSDLFNRKQANVKTLRAPLLRGIEKSRAQFDKGQSGGRGSWWKAQNGVVALTVKVKGQLLEINGVSTNMMPEERFAEFLGKFAEAVNAGEFDGELTHGGKGTAEVHIAKTPAPAKKPRAGGISPEAAKARGQKAAASRARNKAARAGKA